MHRHKHDITLLQPHVVRGVAAEQVVIHVQRRSKLTRASHFDASQRTLIVRPARRIQRGKHGRRTQKKCARFLNITSDHYLQRSQRWHTDRELRRRTGAALHTAVYPPQSRVQQVFELCDCKIRDVDPTDIRNHDKSFARDFEFVGALNIARQNQDELVAGTKAVSGINHSRTVGLKTRAGIPKQRQPENLRALF